MENVTREQWNALRESLAPTFFVELRSKPFEMRRDDVDEPEATLADVNNLRDALEDENVWVSRSLRVVLDGYVLIVRESWTAMTEQWRTCSELKDKATREVLSRVSVLTYTTLGEAATKVANDPATAAAAA